MLHFQGVVHRPMEDLPVVRERDQVLAIHLQGEDGAGLRLCTGQDGAGHPVQRALERLH